MTDNKLFGEFDCSLCGLKPAEEGEVRGRLLCCPRCDESSMICDVQDFLTKYQPLYVWLVTMPVQG